MNCFGKTDIIPLLLFDTFQLTHAGDISNTQHIHNYKIYLISENKTWRDLEYKMLYESNNFI